MAHPLRMACPNIIYDYTTRTIQQRFLLRPSARLNETVLGAFGRGQQLYPNVKLYGFAVLSNHIELLISASDGESCGRFMGFVNGRLGWEIGYKLHAWRGCFWGRRTRPIPIIDDDALMDRVRYVLEHGVKENLVDSPRAWPGPSPLPFLLHGKPLLGTCIDWDSFRRASEAGKQVTPHDFGTEVEVKLSKLPMWEHLSWKKIQARFARMVTDIEREYAAKRKASGKNPLGVQAILAQHPHGSPAESKHSPAPLCHASSKKLRERFRAAYRAFVDAFREAAKAPKNEAPGVRFPLYCYPPARAFVGAQETSARDGPLWELALDIG